jgi:lysozyme family protein
MGHLQPCLAFTLAAEGGYQCDPLDAGNWSSGVCNVGQLIGTYRGISAPTLVEWYGPGYSLALSPPIMQALPDAVVEAIFGAYFWLPCGCPGLPPGIDLMIFDHAVNCGVRRSVRLLQTAVGVVSDGYVGPLTLAAVQRADAAALIDQMALAQERAYRLTPGAKRFLTGWLARLQRRRAAAHKLLQESVP